MPAWIVFNKDRKVVNIFLTKTAAEKYKRNYYSIWGAKKGLTIEEHEVMSQNTEPVCLGRAEQYIALGDTMYFDPVYKHVFSKVTPSKSLESTSWRYQGDDSETY